MKLNKTKYPTRSILRWLWSHHKGCRTQAVTNVVVGLLQVGLGLWGVEQLRQLTDVATGKQEGHLLWMVALYVGIMLAEFLCHISRTWLAAVLGVRTQNMMQRQFFERILKGKWSGIERFHSGDVLNRLFGDVNDIVNLMSEVLPFLVTIVVQFIASFVYLLLMDSTLAIIIVICCPIFLLLSKLYFRKMRRIVRKLKDSNSDLQATIQESIQHKMVIKVMEMADRMVSRLARRQQLLQWQTQQRARLSILTRTIVFIGFRGAAIAALAYGLVQVQHNVITVGMLMAFTQLVWRIQHPLLDLGRLLPTLVNSFASSERLMELEELPVETPETLETTETSFPLKGVRGSVCLTDVSYQYSAEGRKVLDHFSHEFLPGSFTAVLGETGAGKTTLLRIILRLIEPQEGVVEAPPLRAFSYVPQGNTLFSGSIRENLRFGNPDASTEQMFEALHVAQADFVRDLPKGLDTKCGEGGGGLSEGQAQRIAIARAILRPCSILLLDEATSALDVDTERNVLTAIREHYVDTTIIFVTHRLSAVQFASDEIHMKST